MTSQTKSITTLNSLQYNFLTLAAAAILMVTMGARQSLGLFVSPLNSSTGLGIVTISFALAVGQLMWGVIQPVAGAVADRYGAAKVLIAGLVVLSIGTAMTPFMTSASGLIVSLGLLSAIGSGAGSFSVLIGAAAQRLTADRRGKAAGIINAGGSFGQFVFAPISQTLIQMLGWMGAMWSLAVITLAALPLVRVVSPNAPMAHSAAASRSAPWRAMWDAMGDRSYLLLHAGFFTCGFHIAFLVTHLPGEVNLCGLPPAVASWSLALIGLANIVGSLIAGSSTARFRSKYILARYVRLARAADRLVPSRTEDRVDVLYLCRGPGSHLACHRTAHRRHRGEALRNPVSRHTVRSHAPLASDRRFPWRVSRRDRVRPIR